MLLKNIRNRDKKECVGEWWFYFGFDVLICYENFEIKVV